ncbi:MAG: hypothetical protein HY900_10265 [Deltaproteobacteria bacterium]|nr:hypothetical protein [Deltaproteobacteria bacterium]
MRIPILLCSALALFAAPASAEPVSVEAPQIDEAWGRAQQRSWPQLFAFPEGRQPEAVPEGLQGRAAEELQRVYLKSFAEKPSKMPIFQFGVVGAQ